MKVVGSGTLSDCIAWGTDLKNHLKLSNDDDQALVTVYIKAVTKYIMKYVGLPLYYQNQSVYVVAKDGMLELPRTTGTIATVKEWDSDTVSFTTVTITSTVVDYGTYKCLISDDITNGLEYEVTSTVSLDTDDANLIKTVAYQMVADMYENREDRPDKYAQRSSRLLDMISVML